MKDLSAEQKDGLYKVLQKLSDELKEFKLKQTKQLQKQGLAKLKDFAELTNHYRRFVSPRKVTGKAIDKAKNKFYYETEHFIGGIVQRQERFNKETIKYLSKIEKDIEDIKKILDK